MSKEWYFGRYKSPNIVIVPTPLTTTARIKKSNDFAATATTRILKSVHNNLTNCNVLSDTQSKFVHISGKALRNDSIRSVDNLNHLHNSPPLPVRPPIKHFKYHYHNNLVDLTENCDIKTGDTRSSIKFVPYPDNREVYVKSRDDAIKEGSSNNLAEITITKDHKIDNMSFSTRFKNARSFTKIPSGNIEPKKAQSDSKDQEYEHKKFLKQLWRSRLEKMRERSIAKKKGIKIYENIETSNTILTTQKRALGISTVKTSKRKSSTTVESIRENKLQRRESTGSKSSVEVVYEKSSEAHKSNPNPGAVKRYFDYQRYLQNNNNNNRQKTEKKQELKVSSKNSSQSNNKCNHLKLNKKTETNLKTADKIINAKKPERPKERIPTHSDSKKRKEEIISDLIRNKKDISSKKLVRNLELKKKREETNDKAKHAKCHEFKNKLNKVKSVKPSNQFEQKNIRKKLSVNRENNQKEKQEQSILTEKPRLTRIEKNTSKTDAKNTKSSKLKHQATTNTNNKTPSRKKNPKSPDDEIDPRAKLACKRKSNEHSTESKRMRTNKDNHDDLVITVKQDVNTRAKPAKAVRTKSKSKAKKVKKKFKLIINIECRNSTDSDDTNHSTTERSTSSSQDLSFLDDFNVDEIVDSLNIGQCSVHEFNNNNSQQDFSNPITCENNTRVESIENVTQQKDKPVQDIVIKTDIEESKPSTPTKDSIEPGSNATSTNMVVPKKLYVDDDIYEVIDITGDEDNSIIIIEDDIDVEFKDQNMEQITKCQGVSSENLVGKAEILSSTSKHTENTEDRTINFTENNCKDITETLDKIITEDKDLIKISNAVETQNISDDINEKTAIENIVVHKTETAFTEIKEENIQNNTVSDATSNTRDSIKFESNIKESQNQSLYSTHDKQNAIDSLDVNIENIEEEPNDVNAITNKLVNPEGNDDSQNVVLPNLLVENSTETEGNSDVNIENNKEKSNSEAITNTEEVTNVMADNTAYEKDTNIATPNVNDKIITEDPMITKANSDPKGSRKTIEKEHENVNLKSANQLNEQNTEVVSSAKNQSIKSKEVKVDKRKSTGTERTVSSVEKKSAEKVVPKTKSEPSKKRLERVDSPLMEADDASLLSNHNPYLKFIEDRMSVYMTTKYIMLSEIHKGYFSTVYKCKNVKEGKVYAVKIFKSHFHYIATTKEKMLRDLRKFNPKENYFILEVIENINIHGERCFLSEYYPKSLKQALKENKKSFHIDLVQKLARQLVAAVHMLMTYLIVHADIKPKHILLDHTCTKLKLCGFDRSDFKTKIDIKPCTGTASYRAPEVILGFDADYSIDAWSTALVIYEMATGYKLFPGYYNNEVLYKQQCTLGPIDYDMLEGSIFRSMHYVGDDFKRITGHGNWVPVNFFGKNKRLSKSLFSAYHNDWKSSRTESQITKDLDKIEMLLRLLEEMLVTDPRYRLPINEVAVNEFIQDDSK